MKKEMTCIVCPRGCRLIVEDNKVTGNTCIRGEKYALNELTNPTRNIASTVRVNNRIDTMASVRTSAPIPKKLIFKVMDEINKTSVTAPCKIGEVVISNVLNTGVDILITKNID